MLNNKTKNPKQTQAIPMQNCHAKQTAFSGGVVGWGGGGEKQKDYNS